MPTKNYRWAAGPPVMGNGESFQDAPDPKPALARYGTGSTSTSSVITLTDDTTVIDLAVISASGGGGLAVKWIASSDTGASVVASGSSANFDHVVPATWRQRFVVPVEKQGVANSVVGINVQQGLYKRFAIIGTNTPVPSIFIAEH